MGGEEDSLRSPTVRTATAGDEAAAIATIVLAFAADPVARWPWPHAQDYLAGMPGFVRAFGGNAFAQGGAWCTEDCAGAALWLPPGIHPDEEKMGDSSKARSRRRFAATLPPRSSRWRTITRANRIGTCRSSASIPPIKAKAMATP